MKKKRWYHCSPKRLPIGTLLQGGHKKNFDQSSDNHVYITNEDVPHFTIVVDIEMSKKTWHVYEVRPIGKIIEGHWDDGVVPKASIIRYVGTAKGILNRLKRNTNPRKPKTGSKAKLSSYSKRHKLFCLQDECRSKRKRLDGS